MSSVYEDGLVSETVYPNGDEARGQLQKLGWESLGGIGELFGKNSQEYQDAIANGFYAEAFVSPDGEIVIGFRGTDLGLDREGIVDLAAGADLAVALDPFQSQSTLCIGET